MATNTPAPQTDDEFSEDAPSVEINSPDETDRLTRRSAVASAQNPTVDEVGKRTVQLLWQHRRRMAYIALIASLVIIFSVIGTSLFATQPVVDNLSKFEAFLISAFMTLIGLVGAYMGLATMADVKAGGSRFNK